MSPAGNDTCTLIIVHAFTMIIVRVSCPPVLMFKEIKDAVSRGAKAPGTAEGFGKPQAPHCLSRQDLLHLFFEIEPFQHQVLML